MIECDSGTMRLVDDTSGCYWERVYHDVTWAIETTIEEAEKALASLFVDGRWVRSKRIEQD
jgi:hypothetical protein